MARLIIHLEPIATFREAAKAAEADPVRAAIFAEIGGADGVACSLSDENVPFTDRDLRLVRETVKTEFVLFVPASEMFISRALGFSPAHVVLVPAKKAGATSGGGLDALGQAMQLEKFVHDFRAQEIRVSLLVEPMIQQIKAAAKLNADGVQFLPAKFDTLKKLGDRVDYLENLKSLAMAAEKMGLSVSIGNGLTYQNIPAVVQAVPVHEVFVGRAVFTRALWIGMEAAVRDLAALVH